MQGRSANTHTHIQTNFLKLCLSKMCVQGRPRSFFLCRSSMFRCCQHCSLEKMQCSASESTWGQGIPVVTRWRGGDMHVQARMGCRRGGAVQATATLNKRFVTLYKRVCNAEQACLATLNKRFGTLHKRVCNAVQALWNAAQACVQG